MIQKRPKQSVRPQKYLGELVECLGVERLSVDHLRFAVPQSKSVGLSIEKQKDFPTKSSLNKYAGTY